MQVKSIKLYAFMHLCSHTIRTDSPWIILRNAHWNIFILLKKINDNFITGEKCNRRYRISG